MTEAGNDGLAKVSDPYAVKSTRWRYFDASEDDPREFIALALYRDNLEAFLDHIDEFVNLVKLELSGFDSLELGIFGRLPQLVYLNASGNSLKSVGCEICELANLRFLYLTRNLLETLPDALFYRNSLFELNVSDNRLKSIPQAVADQPELRVLNAAHNQVGELVTGKESWKALERLDLSSNEFSRFDLAGASWPALESLDLNDNQIEELGEPGNALHVRSVSLAGNKLSRLPAWLCASPALESLNVARNRLTELPIELVRSGTLHDFTASGNPVESFPPRGADGLEILRLSDCGLKEVPRFALASSNLKELRLANNHLDSLPEELCNLEQLTELHVQGNELNRLPEASGALSNLVKLDASHNRLAGFPDGLGTIESLRELSASNNRITQLPDSFASLRLTKLNLSGNKLESLPSFLGNYAELIELDLAHNGLTCLPDELRSLAALQTLVLDGNQIEELPRWLAGAENLVRLSVAENPLLNLPPDLADDVTRVREFLKHVQPGRVPNLKMKLVAIGSARGKSGFGELLLGKYAADKEHLNICLDSGLPLTLSIWQLPFLDGSTRERFVLTPSAPYVILLSEMTGLTSSSPESEGNPLADMLDRLREASNDSPMLLVLPRQYDSSAYVELIDSLSGRYNYDVLELDLSEQDDVKRLIRWVKDRLQHDALLAACAGRMIPLPWRRAEMALEQLRDKTRNFDSSAFTRLSVDAGLTQPELMAFSDHLVETGQIARNTSTSFVTTDPRWLDWLLRKLDGWREPESRGRINKESARELMSNDAAEVLIGMEVCFREGGDAPEIIAPQHLPSDPPEPKTFALLRDVAKRPNVRYRFQRLERHHVFQLISALGNGETHGQYWSNGLLISDPTAVVAVEILRDRSEVEVRVLSVAAETRVLADITDVIDRFGRSLNVVIEIPCPCDRCRDHDDARWYSLSSLWEAGRDEKLTCPASGLDVDMAPVLKTFWPGMLDKAVDAPVLTNVFISFNEHDRDLAEKVRSALASYEVEAILFHNELRPGETIVDSIKRYMDASATTLLIVSKDSLQSQWVGQEVLESLGRLRSEGRRFIACYQDDEYLTNDGFVRETRQKLSTEIQKLTHEINRLTNTGTPSRSLQPKLKRLQDLHHNMDDIVSHLREMTGVSLRDADFDTSMRRVAEEVGGR